MHHNRIARLFGPLLAFVFVLAMVMVTLGAPQVVADAGATQRPIADFVSAQGTTNIYVPPVPDFIGWGASTRCASVDYAGVANGWLVSQGHPSLGTTTQGSITERRISDGRAQVSVELHTRNALAWAVQRQPNGCDFAGGPLEFGYRAQELDANPSLSAALASSHLQVVFNVPQPGQPLPDLITAGFCIGSPLCELVSISIRASASGPLRSAFNVSEGTPGRMTVTQTGLLFRGPWRGATADGFPAERIELHVVGR